MGKDGGSGGETQVIPWEGARPYVRQLDQRVGALMDRPSTFFPGQTYADRDRLTTQGMQNTQQYLNEQYTPTWGMGLNALNEIYTSRDVANNPYVNNMIDSQTRLANENLMNTILPEINSGAGLSGGFGGSKYQLAQGTAIGDTSNAILDSARATQLDAYGINTQAANQALAQVPEYLQAGMVPGQTQMAFGAMNEDLAQRGIDERMARHDFRQNEPWQRLANANSILMGQNNFNSQSTAQASNPWATGAALGAGLFGMYDQYA